MITVVVLLIGLMGSCCYWLSSLMKYLVNRLSDRFSSKVILIRRLEIYTFLFINYMIRLEIGLEIEDKTAVVASYRSVSRNPIRFKALILTDERTSWVSGIGAIFFTSDVIRHSQNKDVTQLKLSWYEVQVAVSLKVYFIRSLNLAFTQLKLHHSLLRKGVLIGRATDVTDGIS